MGVGLKLIFHFFVWPQALVSPLPSLLGIPAHPPTTFPPASPPSLEFVSLPEAQRYQTDHVKATRVHFGYTISPASVKPLLN